MKKSIYIACLSVIIIFLAGCSGNQNISDSMVDVDMSNWNIIAKTIVQFPPASNNEFLTLPYEIPIDTDDKRYRRFRIVVQDWATKITRLKIILENNEAWEPDIKGLYLKNSASEVIDIPGGPKNIKRIYVEFWTRGTMVNNPSTVYFWGEI